MQVSITIPYISCLSKNQMWKKDKNGKIYLNPATAAEMDAIAMQLPSYDWQPKVKVHVEIMVYRPNFYMDPPNFVDTIVDAVKVGIGVDDRYFAGKWDYELDKLNPRIEITVRQGGDKE